jgi:hypothetical protein
MAWDGIEPHAFVELVFADSPWIGAAGLSRRLVDRALGIEVGFAAKTIPPDWRRP